MNNITNKFVRCLIGALMVLGLSGNAVAVNCFSLNATLTGDVGAQANCEDFNNFTEIVNSLPGESGGSSADGSCQVNFTELLGADITQYTLFGECNAKLVLAKYSSKGSSWCMFNHAGGTEGDTITARGNNNQLVPPKEFKLCSGAATIGDPAVSIKSTAARILIVGDPLLDQDPEDACSGSTDTVEVIATANNTHIVLCNEIKNLGATNLINTRITTTTTGPFVDVDDIIVGTLASNETKMVFSEPVAITESGLYIFENTILDDTNSCPTCTAADDARIETVGECNSETQDLANTVSDLVHTNTGTCGPKNEGGINSVTALCKNIGDSLPGAQSGFWPRINPITGECEGERGPGMPFCIEVINDPSGDCTEGNAAVSGTTPAGGIRFEFNPTIFYFPGAGGGDSTGTLYCFLDPGEDASVCPKGSFVY